MCQLVVCTIRSVSAQHVVEKKHAIIALRRGSEYELNKQWDNIEKAYLVCELLLLVAILVQKSSAKFCSCVFTTRVVLRLGLRNIVSVSAVRKK